MHRAAYHQDSANQVTSPRILKQSLSAGPDSLSLGDLRRDRRTPAISEDSDCGLEMIMTVQVAEGSANATISQAEHEHYGTRSPAGIWNSRPLTAAESPGTVHVRSSSAPIRVVTGQLPKPVLPVSCQNPCYITPVKELTIFSKHPRSSKQRLRSVCLSSLWITVFGRGPSRALLH